MYCPQLHGTLTMAFRAGVRHLVWLRDCGTGGGRGETATRAAVTSGGACSTSRVDGGRRRREQRVPVGRRRVARARIGHSRDTVRLDRGVARQGRGAET